MMGTRLAPSCPNISMASLKKQNPTNIPQQPPTLRMVTIHWRNIHAVDPRFHSPHQRPSTRQFIPPHNQIHWLTRTPSRIYMAICTQKSSKPNTTTRNRFQTPEQITTMHKYPQVKQPKQDQLEQIPSTIIQKSKRPHEVTNATAFTTCTHPTWMSPEVQLQL